MSNAIAYIVVPSAIFLKKIGLGPRKHRVIQTSVREGLVMPMPEGKKGSGMPFRFASV
jgi:hypothetical protein